MFKKLILSGVGAMALAGATPTWAIDPPTPFAMTADFITKAAQSDEFERKEGRLAEHRGHSSAVKTFAAQMVSDHTMTTIGLKRAIRRAHMTPPAPPPLNGDQIHMISDLKTKHGADFDKSYMDQQIKAHEDTLSVMQAYVQGGEPGPIHDAAQQTAPMVQHHLDMAKDIQSHLPS